MSKASEIMDGQMEPSGLRDASETFTKMQDLLKAKNDTSR